MATIKIRHSGDFSILKSYYQQLEVGYEALNSLTNAFHPSGAPDSLAFEYKGVPFQVDRKVIDQAIRSHIEYHSDRLAEFGVEIQPLRV
jgi:hypothetical protein